MHQIWCLTWRNILRQKLPKTIHQVKSDLVFTKLFWKINHSKALSYAVSRSGDPADISQGLSSAGCSKLLGRWCVRGASRWRCGQTPATNFFMLSECEVLIRFWKWDSDLWVEEEVEKKPPLASVGSSKIVFHQVFRIGIVLCVLHEGLAVLPWKAIVVVHFSILVVLIAERGSGSKEGDWVDSVEDGKEEPGHEKAMCSLVPKLLLRSAK